MFYMGNNVIKLFCITQVLDGEDRRLIARSDSHRNLSRHYSTSTNTLELRFLSDHSISEKGFFAAIKIGSGNFT